MNSKARKIIILASAITIAFVSLWMFADAVRAGSADLGLSEVGSAISLGKQDIRVTAAKIIKAVLTLLGIVALALMLYAGYTWMTAGGNEEKVTQAKTILRNAVIGLVIILSAYAIVSFVLSKLLEATTGVPAHCSNGVKDSGTETGVDCGGECSDCGGDSGGFGGQADFYIARRPQGGQVCVRNVHPTIAFNRDVDINSMKDVTVRQASESPVDSLNNDLVAWWSFESGDISENIIIDRSGSSLNALSDGARTTAGRFGNAMSFDSSDFAATERVNMNSGDTGLTYSAWINQREIRNHSILSHGGGSWNPYSFTSMGLEEGDRLACNTSWWRGSSHPNNYIYTKSDRNNLALNQWNHLVCTFSYNPASDSTLVQGYFNGSQVININTAGNKLPNVSDRPLIIGATAWNNYPPYRPISNFQGLIDEARVYRKALTAAEVRRLYDYDPVIAASLYSVPGQWSYSSSGRKNEAVFTPAGDCGTEGVNGCLAGNTSYIIDIPHWGGDIRSLDNPPKPLNCKRGDGCDDVEFITGEGIDMASPTIRIVYPNISNSVFRLGDTVSTNLQFTDDSGIQTLNLYANNGLVDALSFTGCQRTGEVSIPWPTSALRSGAHTLNAVALDWSARSDTASTEVMLRPTYCFDDLSATGTAGIACPSKCGGECGSCEGVACTGNIDCASGWCEPGTSGSACLNKTRVTDVSPLSGAPGNYVSIYGCYFGTNAGQVYFANTPNPTADSNWKLAVWPGGCPTYWRNNQIIAEVPSAASGQGPIKVRTAPPQVQEDTTADSFGREVDNFRITNEILPGLCQVDPEQGRPEDAVTLRGRNLPTSGGANMQVLFGNLPSRSVGSWGATQISDALVPWLDSGSVDVRVRQGDRISNGVRFRVEAGITNTSPFISEVAPSVGAKGEYVTIRGRNFGSSIGQVLFKWIDRVDDESAIVQGDFAHFPSSCAVNDLWKDDQIIVKFPREADATARAVVGREYYVIVVSASGEFNPPGPTFSLRSGNPRPGICRLDPSAGPIPFPPTRNVTLTGEYFAADTSYGLSLWWPFDESGGAAADGSGNGKNGFVANGARQGRPGRNGSAYEFDGINDYVVYNDYDAFNFSASSFSFMAWVKPTGAVGNYDMAVAKGGTNRDSPGYAMLLGRRGWSATLSDGQHRPDSLISVGLNRTGDETWIEEEGPYDVPPPWRHLAVVVDRTNNLLISYVNGARFEQTSIPTGFGSVDSNIPFSAGAGVYPPNAVYQYQGFVDDVALFSKALSGTEVGRIYDQGVALARDRITWPEIYFWRNGASAEAVTGRTQSSLDSYSLVNFTDTGDTIALRPPVNTQTGPVVVHRNSASSNPVQFTAQDCRADVNNSCAAASRCCTGGLEAGLCKPTIQRCEGERSTGGYVWRFSTRDIPRAPRVLEKCDRETEAGAALPSPSPSAIWDGANTTEGSHHNVCRQALVTIEFTTPINQETINPSNVKVNKCPDYGDNSGNTCPGAAAVTLDPGSFNVGVASRGAAGDRAYIQLRPDTDNRALWQDNAWYQVVLMDGIRSPGAEGRPLAAERSCSDVPGSAYCFVFKTDQNNCRLRAVAVVPYSYWATRLEEPIKHRVGAQESDLYYAATGLSDQRCIMMDMGGFGWRWSTSNTTYARIYDGATTRNRARVSALANTVNVGLGNPDDAVNVNALAIPLEDNSIPGLLGHWTFDQETVNLSAGTVRDVSGRGYNGTIQGGVTTMEGKIGEALRFDGNRSAIALGTPISSLDLYGGTRGAVTIAAWVKPASVREYLTIIGRTAVNSLAIDYRGSNATPKLTAQAMVVDSAPDWASRWVDSQVAIPQQVWTHVAFTFEGERQIKYYINGGLVADIGTADLELNSWGGPAYIGAFPGPTSVPVEFFQGAMDDVRVYSRALSATEIAEIYSRNYPPGHSPLTIDLTNPQVEEFWPNCLEACPNAEIGVKFNTTMSSRNLNHRGENGPVRLWKCVDENCLDKTPVTINSLALNARDSTKIDIISDSLDANKLYMVEISARSTPPPSNPDASPRTLWTAANITDANSFSRPYNNLFSWRFRTKRESCRIERVQVSPSVYTAFRFNDRAIYRAEPFSAPDACSVNGQRLNPWSVNWQWSSSDTDVATVEDFATLGNNRYCASRCIKKGSDLAYSESAAAAPVCGNNRIEAGEDCDPPNSDNQCGLNCKRLGNSRIFATPYDRSNPATHGFCGNGRVEPESGETCDTADPGSRVGCEPANCLKRGSAQSTAAGAVEASICGNGMVGSGEDCDTGKTASPADVGSALNCTSNCLHTGTRLFTGWCDTNRVARAGFLARAGFSEQEFNSACNSALSQCGDRRTDPDEDTGCELTGGGRASFCNDYCLWNSATQIISEAPAYRDCVPDSAGCSPTGQHLGSSLLYRDAGGASTPSVCGDGATGVGEDNQCEVGLTMNNREGRTDPWALAVGVGSGDADTSLTPPSMRADIKAATADNTSGGAKEGSGQFIIPCGYTSDEQCRERLGEGYALGANSCCYVRPHLISVYPGSTTSVVANICPNTVIEAVFDQRINPATLQGNFIIARGVGREVPRTPYLSGRLSRPVHGAIEEVRIVGNKAYAASREGGLQIINVTRSSAPVVETTVPPRCDGAAAGDNCYTAAVEVSGSYAYIADVREQGDNRITTFRVIDITTMTPNERGFVNVSGAINSIRVLRNQKAYVTAGANGFRIIDVRDPASPALEGLLDTAGTAEGLEIDGNYAYIADGSQGLRIVNISSSANPREIGFLSTDNSVRFVDVQGNYAYLTEAETGMRIVDISNRQSPTTVVVFRPPGLAVQTPLGIHVSGNYAYLSNSFAGFVIIDISNPANPTRRFNMVNMDLGGGKITYPRVAGDYVYVPTGGGLSIVDISFLTTFNCTGNEDVSRLVASADNADSSWMAPWYVKVWRRIAGFFGGLFGWSGAQASHVQIRSVKWCAGRDLGAVTVAPVVGNTATSRVMLNLQAPLAFDSDYAIILKDGIKDTRGVSIGQYGNRPHRWQFITKDQLCEIDNVLVTPSDYYFATAGASAVMQAEARTSYGARIQSLPGYYAWNYIWGPVNPYVEIASAPAPDTSAASSFAATTAKNRNGEIEVRASANIIDNLYSSAYGIQATGQSHVTVFLCSNPWPPKDLYLGSGAARTGPYRVFPYEDKQGNNDNFVWEASRFDNNSLPAATVAGAGDRGYFNFSAYYCADNGSVGTIDDLPYMKPAVQVTSEVTSEVTSLKRFLFTSDKNNDAIGIQIFANPEHLSPEQWFSFATTSGGRGFRGATRSLTVAGYPAVTDGNNIYVDALHYSIPTRRLENYMYLFSINSDAGAETRNVFEQMINNLRFNINLTNSGYCGGSPESLGSTTACQSDFDCTAGQTCGNSVDKLKRNYQRLRDLSAIQSTLESYDARNRPVVNPIVAWDFGQGYATKTEMLFPSSPGNSVGNCQSNCPALANDVVYGQTAKFAPESSVAIKENPNLDIEGDEFSLEAVVKWQGPSIETQQYPVLAKGRVSGTINANYGLVLVGTGGSREVAYPMFVTRNVLAVAPSLNIIANEWSNIRVTVKEGVVKFYVNGRMAIASQRLTSFTPNDDNLRVGNGFNGLIKRIAIYNQALEDSYPDLRAGTYLTGQTISTWPSWNVLSTAAGGGLFPVDPINRLGAAGTCTPSSSFRCQTNADCGRLTGSSAQRCTPHDQTTGWSAADRRFSFACAISSLAYRYFHSTSAGYIVRARLENPFVAPISAAISNWEEFRNFFVDPTRVITEEPSGICTQAEEISTIDRGRCGDGRINVNLGEQCDPPGRVEYDSNSCAAIGSGAVRSRTCSAAKDDSPGCRWRAWTECVVVLNCGNGIVESGEACDDGRRLNGRYNQCNSDCSGRSALGQCGDRTKQPRFEICDTREQLTAAQVGWCRWGVNFGNACAIDADCNRATSPSPTREGFSGICQSIEQSRVRYSYTRNLSCNWDCQSYGPYCGDGVVQTQYGEQCEIDTVCGTIGTKRCDRRSCRWTNPAAVAWWSLDDAIRLDAGEFANARLYLNSAGASPTWSSMENNAGACTPLSSCPAYTSAGRVNGAFEFDGINDHIKVTHNDQIISSMFTIEAWIKPLEETRNAVIMEKGSERVSGENDAGGYGLELKNDQKAKFNIWNVPAGGGTQGDAITNSVVSQSLIPADAWTYLAATYDGITMRLYVNGVGEATTTPAAITFNDTDLTIGKSSVGGLHFEGLIDEVAYYNRALADQEIVNKYQNNNVFCSASTTPTAAADTRCGNSRIDTAEACDRGAQNGVACAPTYGRSCSYCANDCRHVVNVLPNQYCGNGIIEGTEACDVSASDVAGPIWSVASLAGRTETTLTRANNGYRVKQCAELANSGVSAPFSANGVYTAVDASGRQLSFVAYGKAGLVILNIVNGRQSTVLGIYDTNGTAMAVTVNGDLAYVADGEAGLKIINVADPQNPRLVGSFDTRGFANDISLYGVFAIVADGEGGITILGVVDPSDPILMAEVDTSGPAMGVDVDTDNHYIYAALGEWGLQAIDLGNGSPASPVLAGRYDTPGFAYDVYREGETAYVADGREGVIVVNISNRNFLSLIRSFVTAGTAMGIAKSDSALYVADGENGLVIIALPANTLVGNYHSGLARKVYRQNRQSRYTYLADGASGLRIISDSDPIVVSTLFNYEYRVQLTPKKGNVNCANSCGRINDGCVECGTDSVNGVEVSGQIINVLDPDSSKPLIMQASNDYESGKIGLYFTDGRRDALPLEGLVAYQKYLYDHPVRSATYTLKQVDELWGELYESGYPSPSPALINSSPLCTANTSTDWGYRVAFNGDLQSKHAIDFPIVARPNPWQYDMALSPIIRKTPYAGGVVIAARPNDVRVVVSWRGNGEFYGGFTTPNFIEGTGYIPAARTRGIFYYTQYATDPISQNLCRGSNPGRSSLICYKQDSIWYHGFGSTDGGMRAESFTLDTANNSMTGDKYAFYVRSTDPIRNYLTSANNLKVEVYLPEDETVIAGSDQSWRHFSRPAATYYLNTASTSGNSAAEYWQVFNIKNSAPDAVVTASNIEAVNRVRTNPSL